MISRKIKIFLPYLIHLFLTCLLFPLIDPKMPKKMTCDTIHAHFVFKSPDCRPNSEPSKGGQKAKITDFTSESRVLFYMILSLSVVCTSHDFTTFFVLMVCFCLQVFCVFWQTGTRRYRRARKILKKKQKNKINFNEEWEIFIYLESIVL